MEITLKELIKRCKVEVVCGKCKTTFAGKEDVCPSCNYNWKKEKLSYKGRV